MLSLLTPRVKTPAGRTSSRIRQLSLESLESRDTPTSLSLGVSYGYEKTITLFGDLSDSLGNIANRTIEIGGQAIGEATTDSQGHYSVTLEAAGLGNVTAFTTDLSASASVTLTDIAPTMLTFDAIEGPGRLWTFKGTLSYHRPFQSITVYFGGSPDTLQGKTTTTDESGNFEVVYQLSGELNDNGTAWAKAVSPYGIYSEELLESIIQNGTGVISE